MGLFDKINGSAEALGKNTDFLTVVAILMEYLEGKEPLANEYCMRLRKITEALEADKKGVIAFVQKSKGTADYLGIVSEVHNEKTRLQVNSVLKNQYSVEECFSANEWNTISDLDFACRIQSKIMAHYMQTCGDSFEEATSKDEVFMAMSERISLIHMKKTNGF